MALDWHHKDLDLDYGASDWSEPGVALNEVDDDTFARAIREGRTTRSERIAAQRS